jgi:hypothetical protein
MAFSMCESFETFDVSQIMTLRDELLCWERGAPQAPVLAQAREDGYNVVPVTEESRIVDVLLVAEERTEPLTRDWLVSRDTGLPALLDLFVETAKPVLLVLHGQDVVGLVSPADLNKLAMRVYLYHLIGGLEMGLKDLISEHFRGIKKRFWRLWARLGGMNWLKSIRL